MCLREKIHVLEKLPLGVSSSAVGLEFNSMNVFPSGAMAGIC